MMNLQPKAIDCLRIAATPLGPEREALHEAAAARWSAKAVWRKLEELYDRGYVECGTSELSCWLTEKGRTALEASTR